MRLLPAGVALLAAVAGTRAAAAPAPSSSPLTPLERRGRQIYLTGTSPSGKPVTASMGGSSLALPGSVLPCANCHGYDGRGKPEGGVVPPEIRWEALTKPYGRRNADGRLTPPHNEATVAAAITAGVDPAGNALSPAMPKYALDPGDLSALVSFLRRLGSIADPGITDAEIVVGTLAPSSGPLAGMGRAVQDVLSASFKEINERGGVYGRRLRLRVLDAAKWQTGPGPSNEPEDVFAIAGAVIEPASQAIVTVCETAGIPLIVPLSRRGPAASASDRYAFHLFSDVRDEGRALVDFAALTLGLKEPRAAIVACGGAPADVAEAVEAQVLKAGWMPALRVPCASGPFDAPDLARRLREARADAVFFLGSPGEETALARAMARTPGAAKLFVPGSLAGREILELPESLAGRVFLAYPVWPEQPGSSRSRELDAFLERHGLAPGNRIAQVSAYGAVKILVDGLQRSGRDVSREKLVSSLEGLYDFETGVTPPVTYGPSRRIGVAGASVGTIDTAARTLRRESAQIIPR